MRTTVRLLILPAALLLGAVLPGMSAHAQPQVPATVYGSVTIDGRAAPPGTEVRAFIAGVDCTQAAPGERGTITDGPAAAYVVAVVSDSQRPGCGRTGAIITFTVAGRPALQSIPWEPGPIRLDLSVGSEAITPLPTPSPAPPTPTPPSGPPPTDDVTLPGTLVPAPASPAPSPAGSGQSSSLAPAVIATLVVLASGGVAAGILLARRTRPRP